ncbi:MAG: hypothetical protein M9913_09435 [Bryobacteraceae bacterium]|nr:hypothetical protein [Solibacteraceae bacterium]MCO5351106.1 hypothetical protein [Bryobacteraceae bacterium]
MARNPLRRHLSNLATAFERVGPARRLERVEVVLKLPADDNDLLSDLQPGALIPEGEPFESPYTAVRLGEPDEGGMVRVTLTWTALP